MMKKNAPYSGARRQANMQVADNSNLGAAARAFRTLVPGGRTMVDTVQKSKPGYRRDTAPQSQPARTNTSNRQEDYTSTPAYEKRLMEAAKRRSRVRGGQ